MFTVLCLQLKRHVGLKSPLLSHFSVATPNPQPITSVLRSFPPCINPDSNKPDSDDRSANAQNIQSGVGVFVVCDVFGGESFVVNNVVRRRRFDLLLDLNSGGEDLDTGMRFACARS